MCTCDSILSSKTEQHIIKAAMDAADVYESYVDTLEKLQLEVSILLVRYCLRDAERWQCHRLLIVFIGFKQVGKEYSMPCSSMEMRDLWDDLIIARRKKFDNYTAVNNLHNKLEKQSGLARKRKQELIEEQTYATDAQYIALKKEFKKLKKELKKHTAIDYDLCTEEELKQGHNTLSELLGYQIQVLEMKLAKLDADTKRHTNARNVREMPQVEQLYWWLIRTGDARRDIIKRMPDVWVARDRWHPTVRRIPDDYNYRFWTRAGDMRADDRRLDQDLI